MNGAHPRRPGRESVQESAQGFVAVAFAFPRVVSFRGIGLVEPDPDAIFQPAAPARLAILRCWFTSYPLVFNNRRREAESPLLSAVSAAKWTDRRFVSSKSWRFSRHCPGHRLDRYHHLLPCGLVGWLNAPVSSRPRRGHRRFLLS